MCVVRVPLNRCVNDDVGFSLLYVHFNALLASFIHARMTFRDRNPVRAALLLRASLKNKTSLDWQ